MKETLPAPEKPLHPGLILKFECECREETVEQLAMSLEQDAADLQRVFDGLSPITPLLALRIQQHWEISAGLLISVQRDHDAWVPETGSISQA